jgi:type I restriction enzyme S subunit
MSDLVPEGWSNTIFGELTESIKSGLSRRIVAQDIGIPVLISGNIQNNILDTNEFKYWYVNDPQGADTSRYLLNDGDILLCFINSMAQIGKVCIYRDIGRPAIYTTNLFRVVANPSCSPVFVYQLMTYQTFQEEIQLITKPAVNQASFTKGDLVEIPVKLPPLPEQQKIAAILSSVDEVIEKTQAQINKLKDLKTGMMQELLSHREGQAANISNPQGESKNSLHHTEFKDSPLGRIPVGWEVVKTGDISKSIVPGRNKPKSLSGDIPWLTIADLDSFYVDKSKKNLGVTYENLREANGKTIPAKSVIMSVVGEFGISSVARCEMVINQQLHGFVCNEDIDPAFLCLSLRHHKLQQERLATQTTIAYMNKDNAESILFAKPPFSQQLKIAASILAVDKKINVLNSKHSSYINTKKALMQDLLTGKVRVTVPSHPCDHGISASMHVTVDAS